MTSPSLPPDVLSGFRAVRIPNFYAGDPGEPDDYTVEQIASDGNIAEGYCYDVSMAFIEHLAAHGIEGKLVETTGTELYGRFGYGDHYVVQVNDTLVDWTAAQFIDTKRGEPRLIRRSS